MPSLSLSLPSSPLLVYAEHSTPSGRLNLFLLLVARSPETHQPPESSSPSYLPQSFFSVSPPPFHHVFFTIPLYLSKLCRQSLFYYWQLNRASFVHLLVFQMFLVLKANGWPLRWYNMASPNLHLSLSYRSLSSPCVLLAFSFLTTHVYTHTDTHFPSPWEPAVCQITCYYGNGTATHQREA